MGDSRVPNAATDCRPDTGRGGGFCGHHGSCLGPYLRRCRRMQISNQASLHGSPSAHGIFLHIPPRTSFISVPASRACCAEWRDAARAHHFEVRKAVGRKPNGPVSTRKACPLPREHGPVNWYSTPLSLDGVTFRFLWIQDFVRKVIRASTSAGPPIDPLYSFKCITFPNRYWKEPLGWPRAKPVGRAPEIFN